MAKVRNASRLGRYSSATNSFRTHATRMRYSRPYRVAAGGNLYYGSGFSNGSNPGSHLQEHTTFDFSIGRSFAERFTASVTALNLTNRRFLSDNSQTFGGTHYADPRQIYLEVRYRFHY